MAGTQGAGGDAAASGRGLCGWDMLLSAGQSQLLVVDVQERLMPAVAHGEAVAANVRKLILVARRLGIPVSASEQNPQRLGGTIAAVRAALDEAPVFPKLAFSCARDGAMAAHVRGLREAGRGQLVLCGVEAHVCVLQSAIDFAGAGHATAVVEDAATSRDRRSHELAMRRLEAAGVAIVSTEMVLFEWLERAGTPAFKDVLALIK